MKLMQDVVCSFRETLSRSVVNVVGVVVVVVVVGEEEVRSVCSCDGAARCLKEVP